MVIWFGFNVETNAIFFSPLRYIIVMIKMFGWEKNHLIMVKKRASISKYTDMFYIYSVWYIYMCGGWGRLSRLYFQFPKQCWTLLLREFTVFALGTGYSHSGLFWCAFRLYNQSQNSAQECMMGATCAQLNIRTLLNIQNVQIKPITLSVTKNFALLFGATFIRWDWMYGVVTLFQTYKECFWPFAFL